ncbi:MAG: hypothetical protein Q9214_005305 [Letrouitia sp. 1 TL-2023]
MTGLCWTYETFCIFISQLTSPSLSPLSVADLNPIIKQLLIICPNSSIFDVGAHSVLLSITEHIAAKVPFYSGNIHLRHEQTIFELLDRAPCPYIIQSFFRGPDITFMQLLRNGTLHQRMTMLNKPRHVLPWIQQLSDAVACIESLGYAHGDINPQNILLDDDDQLKLVDFDHARKIGDDVEVGYEPYVRFHRHGTANGAIYGIAGPITEQFALGSIFWYITRGAELYADLEGPEQVNRLMDGKFPATDPQDPIDSIISDCWLGKFQSIADLSKHVRKVAAFNKTYQEREKTCAQLYQLL